MEKHMGKITSAYFAALEFGVADLNSCADPRCNATEYFAAIVRHEKLTVAIRNGLEALKLIREAP